MDRLLLCGLAAAVALTGQDAMGQNCIARARPGEVPHLDRSSPLAALGVREVRKTVQFELADAELAAALGLDRYYTLELEAGRDAATTAAGIARLTTWFETVEVERPGGIADVFPSDPMFASQWALHNRGQGTGCGSGLTGIATTQGGGFDINAPEAWGLWRAVEGVRVAVLDSGISPHPDLPPLKPGWAHDGGSVDDQCNHGTHVAGIIAAVPSNGVGIAGIAWGAKLVPVRVLSGCTGTDVNYGLGLLWAADRADIANSSLQYYNPGSFMHNAVLYAAGQGLVMVAASGNWASTVAYPARWPEVIAVGATDHRDERPAFSNMGPEVDFCAPGDDVLSLSTGASGAPPRYMCMSGTSMASPHIAGAVALIRMQDRSADEAWIRRVLIGSARDLGTPGHDPGSGWGRLDLAGAMSLQACYADADLSGEVNSKDVLRFHERHTKHHPYADVNDDGVWDQADVLLWQGMYAAGCP